VALAVYFLQDHENPKSPNATLLGGQLASLAQPSGVTRATRRATNCTQWIILVDRIVFAVRIWRPGLIDDRIDTQELGCLGVVVAPDSETTRYSIQGA
jgi:hypothetical protein